MALLAYSRPILVTKRSLLVLTIAVAAFLGQGSDAFASSTVHSSNTPGFSWVLLVSGDGADSVVNISRLGNTVTVTDTTGATAGTGCTQVNPTTSSCGVLSDETGQIFAQPGGGNDSVTLDQDMEYADATLEGAAGNDTLTGGAGRDLDSAWRRQRPGDAGRTGHGRRELRGRHRPRDRGPGRRRR